MKSEKALIKNLQAPATRERAFGELLDLYQERLYWHIRKMVVNHDNASDVLQNTFVRVYKNIHGFKGNSSLLTWMYRIAYNESLRFIAKNKKLNSLEMYNSGAEQLSNLSHDAYFDGDKVKLKLHTIIAGLTDKQQLVFRMKYFDELSFREISEITDVTENTLKSSYYAAVKIIEEKIIL